MSGGLTKLLDKAFLLGYALPSLLFLIVVSELWGCPSKVCTESNPFAGLTFAVLLVYGVAIFAVAVNYRIYRFFEGYSPPLAWIVALKRYHQRRLGRLKRELGHPPSANKLWRLSLEYPEHEGSVLPTAFGNAIRAFESYPSVIYGIDAIGGWPRIQLLLSKDAQALINDAKALVDLWINITALALGLAIVSSITAFLKVTPLCPSIKDAQVPVSWLLIAVISYFAAFVAYRFAVDAVPAWGNQVKSAFDCYLPALAVQLGFDLPPAPEQRRKIWIDQSQQWLYNEKPEPRFLPYARKERHVSKADLRSKETADDKMRQKGDESDAVDDDDGDT
jgi:hypothetical protein